MLVMSFILNLDEKTNGDQVDYDTKRDGENKTAHQQNQYRIHT